MACQWLRRRPTGATRPISRAAYGFSARKDLLAQLLALNLDVAARIERGEPVTAPGVPQNHPNPASLVTTDCIEPPDLPGIGTGREQAEADAAHFYMGKEEGPPYRTKEARPSNRPQRKRRAGVGTGVRGGPAPP